MPSSLRHDNENFEAFFRVSPGSLCNVIDVTLADVLSHSNRRYGRTLCMKERRWIPWCGVLTLDFEAVSHYRERVMKAKSNHFLYSRIYTVKTRKYVPASVIYSTDVLVPYRSRSQVRPYKQGNKKQ